MTNSLKLKQEKPQRQRQRHDASRSNTTQHEATRSNTKHHDATRSITTQHDATRSITTRHDATRSITKHHDATRSNTTQHDASRRNTMHHDATRRKDVSPHGNIFYTTKCYSAIFGGGNVKWPPERAMHDLSFRVSQPIKAHDFTGSNLCHIYFNRADFVSW